MSKLLFSVKRKEFFCMMVALAMAGLAGCGHTLTVDQNMKEGGTISRNPEQKRYSAATAVTVTTTPNLGYAFTGWSGDTTSSDLSIQLNMSKGMRLTANYKQVPTYTLTISADSIVGGVVERIPEQPAYNEGAQVTVKAVAAEGYGFVRWVGASISNDAEITITIDSNQTLTPVFQQIFTDPRDGQKYRITKIGSRTWMAENLNFKADGSLCYENKESNCAKYGRLYGATVNCPAGWRVPTDRDWNDLVKAAGGNVAGRKLKSKADWDGTDEFDFSALPGGNWYNSWDDEGESRGFSGLGSRGFWWSSTINADHYNGWYMESRVGTVRSGAGGDFHTSVMLSVRCVQ